MTTVKKLGLFSVLFLLLSFKNTSAQTVYITEKGKKYHVKSCPAVKANTRTLELNVAQKKGYTACTNCGADTIKVEEKKETLRIKEEKENE